MWASLFAHSPTVAESAKGLTAQLQEMASLDELETNDAVVHQSAENASSGALLKNGEKISTNSNVSYNHGKVPDALPLPCSSTPCTKKIKINL